MRAENTISALAGFDRRGAGTDAERRAALWLAGERRDPRRDAELETFWCRPNWAVAAAWHMALGLAGSLVAVSSPVVGLALVALALLSVIWAQSVRRSRPSTTGWSRSSSAKPPGPNDQPRVWASRLSLALRMLSSAIACRCLSSRP